MMTTTKRPAAANDNQPRHAGEFGDDLKARRDWLGTLPKAKPKPDQGNRIERALVKEKSPLVATLRQIAELMRPAKTDETVDMGGGDDDEGGDKNTGYGTEQKHNQSSFTPSIPKLLNEYAEGIKIGTSYHHDKSGESVTIGGKTPGTAGRMKFHGLRFHRGKLVLYGDNGRMRVPKYTGTKNGLAYGKDSETERHVKETKANNLSYLALPGTAPLRGAPANDNAPRSPSPAFRTDDAAAARLALDSAANDNAPITYCPDAIAAGYGRLGGISESAGPGSTTAPRHAALDEMDRAETFADMNVDEADIEIIEAILADESFRAIGTRLGFAKSSAHKSGRQAVERALETISKKIAA